MARASYQNVDNIVLGRKAPVGRLVKKNHTVVTVCPTPSFQGAVIAKRDPKPILRLRYP